MLQPKRNIYLLPDEILLEVFRHISSFKHDENTVYSDRPNHNMAIRFRVSESATFASLCRTSKRFNELAEPLLYQTFVKKVNAFSPSNAERRSVPGLVFIPPNDQLRGFLRTIIHRPALALHIRTIILQWWETDHSGLTDGFEFSPPDDKTLDAFRTAANKFIKAPHSNRSEWKYALADGNEDAEIALLLALATNLTSLEFKIPLYFRVTVHQPQSHIFMLEHLPRTILHTGSARPQVEVPMKRLQRVFVWEDSPAQKNRNDAIHLFRPLMFLPKITNFAAYGVRHMYRWNGAASDNWPILNPLHTLKSLRFIGCVVDAYAIKAIVDTCNGLECFELVWYPSGSERDAEYAIGFDHLCTALKGHRSTLRELTLRLRLAKRFAEAPELFPKFNRLRDFTALEVLTIEQDLILEPSTVDGATDSPEKTLVEEIPQSIVNLTIRGSSKSILPQLQRLATLSRSRFKALKTVVLRDLDVWWDVSVDLTGLTKLFLEAGVEFECPNLTFGD